MFNKNINSKKIPDWVELIVLEQGQISLSDIEGIFDELDIEGAKDILFLLSNRLYLYGNNAPYRVESDMVTSCIDKNSLIGISYKLLLFLSTFGNNYNLHDAGKIFERLSNESFKKYLGGESMVFGFPDGLTGGLSEKIDELAIKIGERRGAQNPLSTAKDDKLDLVSYKTIDSRENKVLFLTQSAAGGNWEQKLAELPIDLWRDYINFGISPIRGFSTPVFIDDNNKFYNKGKRGGLLFDRARLYRFTSQITSFKDVDLLDSIKNWNIGAENNYQT